MASRSIQKDKYLRGLKESPRIPAHDLAFAASREERADVLMVAEPSRALNAVKILQINANRCRQAMDLCHATTAAVAADIIAISEPNRKTVRGPGYYVDKHRDAAIKVVNSKRDVDDMGSEEGFVWIKYGKTVYYSCYFSPNTTNKQFEDYLTRLATCVNMRGPEIVITGDFNAKSQEWGDNRQDERGKIMSEWVASLNLTIANDGSKPTLVRPNGTSYVDLTLVTPGLAAKITDCCVLDEETLSDHRYIVVVLKDYQKARAGNSRWVYGAVDKTKYINHIKQRLQQGNLNYTPEECATVVQEAYQATTIRVRTDDAGKPPYWWSAEIASLRVETLSVRRELTRYRSRRNNDPVILQEKLAAYTAKKKELRREIGLAKKRCWSNLCQELNNDVWGEAYHIVRRMINPANQSSLKLSDEKKLDMVSQLFPEHPKAEWEPTPDPQAVPFTADELKVASSRIKKGKAPRIDRILPECVKLLVDGAPSYILRVMNKCLGAGEFPKNWKEARVVPRVQERLRGGN